MTGKDAAAGGLSPVHAHAETGRTHRRAEIAAGVVLVTLILLVALGWWLAPDAAAPAQGDDTFTYTAVTSSGGSAGDVTALIIAFMIIGAALIGLAFFSPQTAARRPRRSGAAARVAVPIPRATTDFVPVWVTHRVRPALDLCLTAGRVHKSPGSHGPQKFRGGGGVTYSSTEPGAVFETVIRNSMLLLVFFNRSTMRSIA